MCSKRPMSLFCYFSDQRAHGWSQLLDGGPDQLRYCGAIAADIRDALASAARAGDQEVKDHISKRNGRDQSGRPLGKLSKGSSKGGHDDKNQNDKALPNSKEYERELNGSSETLRHLERLQVTSGSPGRGTPSLVELPLQLGFCSAVDFHESDDDCRRGSKQRQLPDFLAYCCSTGMLTWKVRYNRSRCILGGRWYTGYIYRFTGLAIYRIRTVSNPTRRLIR